MASPAERLGEALRAAHPDAEPSEIDSDTLERWVAEIGDDPLDAPLIAAAVGHWELLIV